MIQTDSIKQIIGAELDEFNAIFAESFSAPDLLLQKVLQHLHQRKGKQIRPMLVLLSAKLSGQVVDNTHFVAAAFEMLHTASLVHDDVVDNAFERRRQPSVNALFDNRTAVLIGDYLLTTAMSYVTRTRNIQLVDSLVEIGLEMTKGELLQLQLAYCQPTEEEYYNVIRRKTAILFALCTEAGAISAGATKVQSDALRSFGMHLGLCFQIKDDIFDYTRQADIGKPTFNDIREGKITLPLLHALQKATEEEHTEIFKLIDKRENLSEDDLDIIDALVTKYGGIAYASEQMSFFREQALADLQIFPDSDVKSALIDSLNFVLKRKQ